MSNYRFSRTFKLGIIKFNCTSSRTRPKSGGRPNAVCGVSFYSLVLCLLETASNNSKINLKITIAEKGLFYCLLCGYLCMCVCMCVPRVATRPLDLRPSNFHTMTLPGSSCAFWKKNWKKISKFKMAAIFRLKKG